ncbi:MAG: glutamate-5-semialdehyde dehydrogenase [Clostridia bacterium]|nr:glutamate-5-semialdehyde dehydrogenase [Clostridia bacterium]
MEIRDYILNLEKRAADAAMEMGCASFEKRNEVLLRLAAKLRENTDKIIDANKIDLDNAKENGVAEQMLDRLALNMRRIEGMAASLEALIKLKDPIGGEKVWVRDSGIEIHERRVPLGVVAIIFEARPNVTLDAAALCIKTGNVALLRGGKEALNSSMAIRDLICDSLAECGLPRDGVVLVERTEREGATALMAERGYVDVLIPRGGKGLIKNVVENAKVPVIETGAGNCHIYVEKTADFDMARSVIVNAKVQRPSVCNACESLLVDRAIADRFLPLFEEDMKEHGVEIRADENCFFCFKDARHATEEDHFTEYNDLVISVKIVENVGAAIAHINEHGTKHSEAIITKNVIAAEKFAARVDAAAVYVNTSTRFTDGGEFGYGAEIGISTQKLHARGPMGLRALTTVKYIVDSDGAIRK